MIISLGGPGSESSRLERDEGGTWAPEALECVGFFMVQSARSEFIVKHETIGKGGDQWGIWIADICGPEAFAHFYRFSVLLRDFHRH
jgi:hypothetical protein